MEKIITAWEKPQYYFHPRHDWSANKYLFEEATTASYKCNYCNLKSHASSIQPMTLSIIFHDLSNLPSPVAQLSAGYLPSRESRLTQKGPQIHPKNTTAPREKGTSSITTKKCFFPSWKAHQHNKDQRAHEQADTKNARKENGKIWVGDEVRRSGRVYNLMEKKEGGSRLETALVEKLPSSLAVA